MGRRKEAMRSTAVKVNCRRYEAFVTTSLEGDFVTPYGVPQETH